MLSYAQMLDVHDDSTPNYLFFVGFGHSGHSLVGALIDAHADACIANEANFFATLEANPSITLPAAKKLLLSAAQTGPNQAPWLNTGYSYVLSGGNQGSCRTLRVLGDKKGGQTAEIIARDPTTLETALSLFGKEIRFLSVIKNPYDIVAASAFRRGESIQRKHIALFQRKANVIAQMSKNLSSAEMQIVRYELLVSDFQTTFSNILEYLQLEVTGEFLSLAQTMIRKDIPRRRTLSAWPNDVRDEMEKLLQSGAITNIFNGYAFSEPP